MDFSGLPEMVRTFLQMAAGAADIPVTRLLGQSPAGLSATGESDTRNDYDMIAARQELDLRPQLERLDAFVLRSAGVEPGGVSFAFRPLWQLSAGERAGIALQRAQTTAVYAGLSLWPMATTAALARSQLLADGTYPGAAAAFAGEGDAAVEASSPTGAQSAVADYSPDQPRDHHGRWTEGAGATATEGEASTVASQHKPLQPHEQDPRARLILAATTTTNFQRACKVLKIDPIRASDALHAAKGVLSLGGAAQCVFDLTNGNILFDGEVIGNLGD